MTRNILVVDDDQEMLLSLKEGLEGYGETLSVLMAGDGLVAIEKLKISPISLVVSDIRMGRMDGFTLLTYIMQYYPGLPVILMTGYGTADTERQALARGALGYIEKPFTIENLSRQIMTVIRRESDGGTLQGISSGNFLQLIGMEEKTCTIRLVDKLYGKHGVLFFKEGELLNARVGNLQGETAAYEIFAWDEVNLSIQNACHQKEKKIKSDLQAVLLEAMRLKDEAADNGEEPVSLLELKEESGNRYEVRESKEVSITNHIKSKVEGKLGKKCGLMDICEDDSWDSLLTQMAKIGEFFGAGKLKLVYVDKEESNDFILLPGQETTVVSVNPKCPRERIIQALTDK